MFWSLVGQQKSTNTHKKEGRIPRKFGGKMKSIAKKLQKSTSKTVSKLPAAKTNTAVSSNAVRSSDALNSNGGGALPQLSSPSHWTLLSPAPSKPFTTRQVSLSRTLQGGQCFTWRCVMPNEEVEVIKSETPLQRPVVTTNASRQMGKKDAATAAAMVEEGGVLSTRHPSFIGSFKGNVVQLGVDEASDAIIVRNFTAFASGCGGKVSSSSFAPLQVSDTLRSDLLHYLSADEDLPTLLAEWRASKHPITALLPKTIGGGGGDEGEEKNSTNAASKVAGTSRKRGAKAPSNPLPAAASTSLSTLTDSPVRLLRQDFIECFFSFLCSQNNNVKRIAGLVLKLSEAYGTPLGYVRIVPRGVKTDADEEQPKPKRGRRVEGAAEEKGKANKNTNSASSFIDEVSCLRFYAFPSLQQLKAAMGVQNNWANNALKKASAEAVAQREEERLRQLGFGYRARYIVACAKDLTEDMVAELERVACGDVPSSSPPNLTKKEAKATKGKSSSIKADAASPSLSMSESREEWAAQAAIATQHKRSILTALCGVGRKVADCVLLFSLHERALVPIDTHMAQIAVEYFGDELQITAKAGGKEKEAVSKKGTKSPSASAKSKGSAKKGQSNDVEEKESAAPALTPAMHDKLQACFRRAFGKEAGWAHSFLFAERIGEQNTQ